MKKLYLLLVAMGAASCVLIAYSLFAFSAELEQALATSTELHLLEISNQNANVFKTKIEDQFNAARAFAAVCSELDDSDEKAVTAFLSKICDASEFDRIVLHTADGKGITSDGLLVEDVTDQPFFIDGMNGKTSVYPPFMSPVGDKQIMLIAAPIYDPRGVSGVLTVSYSMEVIDRVFALSFFDGKGYGYVVEGAGNVMLKRQNEYARMLGSNIIQAISSVDSAAAFDIKADMQRSESGIITLDMGNEKRIICYRPLYINDWYMFNMVPYDIVSAQTQSIYSHFFSLSLLIAISFGVLFIIFVIIAQMGRNRLMRANSEIALSEERFRLATVQSDSMVFEFNYEKNKVIFSGKIEDGFKDTSFEEHESLNVANFLPEDYAELESAFTRATVSNPVIDMDLRAKGDDKNPVYWYRFRATTQFDAKKQPLKVIGSITNITREKTESVLMAHKARHDPLTNLYNKVASQVEIDDLIIRDAKCSRHALLAIDIDNFKHVNDNFGHLFGDELLRETASTMTELFRSTDVLGRFGGDEFIVLLRCIPSDDFAIEKANALLSALKKTYTAENVSYDMSVSIGISLCPEHGSNFAELYKCADDALYAAKSKGKATCSVYGKSDGC